jgi:hypothetical protein
MIDKKQLIEELLECVKDATDTETQITGLSICAMLMNEVLDEALTIPVVRRSSEMISEQFQYRGLTFQRMTKDARWYVCYANQIVNWGQYQNDLKEWVDGNYA